MFVPLSFEEHYRPAKMIENRIQRIEGYVEGQRITAVFQALERHYMYLGEGFFADLKGNDVSAVECACRDAYRRNGRSLPCPLFIVI